MGNSGRMPAAAHLVIALAVFLVCGVVNLQIPALETYAVDAGLGSGLTALVLSAYPFVLVGVLASLGGVSDRLGRRPTLLAGVVAAVLATASTVVAPDIVGLGVARGLQGVGVGLTLGSATAWLAAILPSGALHAAATTALASAAGFGLGPLVTHAALELGADPRRPASYLVMMALLGLTALALFALPAPPRERSDGPPPRLARLPAYPPGSGLAALSIVVGWSFAGTVVAVLPRAFAAIGAPSLAGPGVSALIAAGLVAQPFARRLAPRSAVRVGALVLPVGAAVLALGLALGAPALALVGVAVGGASTHGYGYLGGLALATHHPETRARAVSGYFLVAYVGFSLPAMAVGVAMDQLGVAAAFAGLAVALVLGATALVWLTRRSPR